MSATRITELENQLAKAVEMTDALDQKRKDSERKFEQRIWDLKEKLDYANTTKRRYRLPCVLTCCLIIT